MNTREPTAARLGPTRPWAPVMPGISWQAPQPAAEIAAAPREAAPPIRAAALS